MEDFKPTLLFFSPVFFYLLKKHIWKEYLRKEIWGQSLPPQASERAIPSYSRLPFAFKSGSISFHSCHQFKSKSTYDSCLVWNKTAVAICARGKKSQYGSYNDVIVLLYKPAMYCVNHHLVFAPFLHTNWLYSPVLMLVLMLMLKLSLEVDPLEI